MSARDQGEGSGGHDPQSAHTVQARVVSGAPGHLSIGASCPGTLQQAGEQTGDVKHERERGDNRLSWSMKQELTLSAKIPVSDMAECLMPPRTSQETIYEPQSHREKGGRPKRRRRHPVYCPVRMRPRRRSVYRSAFGNAGSAMRYCSAVWRPPLDSSGNTVGLASYLPAEGGITPLLSSVCHRISAMK